MTSESREAEHPDGTGTPDRASEEAAPLPSPLDPRGVAPVADPPIGGGPLEQYADWAEAELREAFGK
jgi:hypothetical protein